jgi:hypothetical protein
MVTARPLPRPLSIGLLVLAALIALSVLALTNTLTVIAPSMSQHPAITITSPEQVGPREPAPSVRSQDTGKTQQGSEQAPTGASRGVTRFADGGSIVGVGPASPQGAQTCAPKCPQRTAR